MPRYTYQCQECGCVMEREHNIHIKLSHTICDKCNKWVWIKKLFVDPFSFILKGPGWAKDGYQGEKNAQSNE
jgi:predicted nucleic acid-binding Zn ribbon protein